MSQADDVTPEERHEPALDGTLGEVACPYKGLHAFEEADAALFFGREEQVQRCLERLARTRFVAVVGASGSGKSSFARAGLIAGVRARACDAPRIVVLCPGEHPVQQLALAFTAATGTKLTVWELLADPGCLRRATRTTGEPRVLIVVDQFEELFTSCDDARERRCFVDAVMGAWRGAASPVSVIVALRGDVYGRIVEHRELAANVVAHQELIGPLTAVQLRRAIELPAAACGLALQPGLAETIVEDVTGEPGAMPLLSHALVETWARRRGRTLTISGYRDGGGVSGAIAQTAELTLRRMPADERRVARAIFLRLTDVNERAEPTRRRVERGELTAPEWGADVVDRVLGMLADARLLSVDADTIEIAHEALIRHWPRLRGWVDADRDGLLVHRRLTDAAREWAELGREPGALYRGARLGAAQGWASGPRPELSTLEREFLAASEHAEHAAGEAARRRADRRLRAVRVTVGASLLIAAIVATLAAWALRQRGDARAQAANATSLALASQAQTLLRRRPYASLLVALAAYDVAARPEASGGVIDALAAIGRSGRITGVLHGHAGAVQGVAFSPAGDMLASAGSDGTLRLWDERTHEALGEPLRGHLGAVLGVAFSADGRTLASGGADDAVRLWDARTQRALGEPLRGHAGPVEDVAFSSDGRMLASAGADNAVRLWDVRARKPLGEPLRGHGDTVFGVAFSADGRRLASGGADGTVRLWDVRTRRPLGEPLRGHGDTVFGVAFSGGGRLLASAGADGTVRLWDALTRRPVGEPLRGHVGAVLAVAFSADGRRLASAGADGTVRLWDVHARKPLGEPLRGHGGPVFGLALSADGRRLASAGADWTARLWDLRAPSTTLRGHAGPVPGVAFSGDGRTLASAGRDRTVRLWDARTRRRVGPPLRGHADQANRVAFSADGAVLASSGDDGTVRLWDVQVQQPFGAPLRGHVGSVFGVAFSPDGRTLASAGDDRSVRLWDARTRKLRGVPLRDHTGPALAVAFSKDGRTLASAGADQTVRLWDARSGEALGPPLRGHAGAIWAMAFSPDGRTFATAGEDETVRLWDVRARKALGTPLRGHAGTVFGVAFGAGGRVLASGGADGTVRLWDVRARAALGAPLRGHAGSVLGVAFGAGGRTLASAGADGTVRLWDHLLWRDRDELHATVCRLVGDGLSRAEWALYVTGIAYRATCP